MKRKTGKTTTVSDLRKLHSDVKRLRAKLDAVLRSQIETMTQELNQIGNADHATPENSKRRRAAPRRDPAILANRGEASPHRTRDSKLENREVSDGMNSPAAK